MFTDLFGMDRFDYQTVVTFFVGKYKSQGTFQAEATQLYEFCKFSPPLDCLTFQAGQGSLIIISNKITPCVAAVKQSYRNVVYHNFTHGFHVANSIYSILKVLQPPNPQSPFLRHPRGSSILWRVLLCMLEPSATTWTTGEQYYQSKMLVPTIKSSNIHLSFCSTPTYWLLFPSWPNFHFQRFQQQIHDRHLFAISWDVCNLGDGEPSLCNGSVNPTTGGIEAKSDFVIRSKTTCWATCTRRSTRQWSATWSTASLRPTSPSSFPTRHGWPILWRRTPSTGNTRITGKYKLSYFTKTFQLLLWDVWTQSQFGG